MLKARKARLVNAHSAPLSCQAAALVFAALESGNFVATDRSRPTKTYFTLLHVCSLSPEAPHGIQDLITTPPIQGQISPLDFQCGSHLLAMALSAQNPQPALDEPLIPEGYHKLAALMGKSRRMSIFRRFGKLTMVNLLDLQAELTDLEERYQVICAADNKSNDPTRTCLSKKFSALRDSETSDVKVNQRQRKMLLIIRKKLAAYRTWLFPFFCAVQRVSSVYLTAFKLLATGRYRSLANRRAVQIGLRPFATAEYPSLLDGRTKAGGR